MAGNLRKSTRGIRKAAAGILIGVSMAAGLIIGASFSSPLGAEEVCIDVSLWEIQDSGQPITPFGNVYIDSAGEASTDVSAENLKTPTNSTYYVDESAAPGGTGLTPGDAFDDISVAFAAIQAAGVGPVDIEVAAGTYNWGGPTNIGFAFNIVGAGPGQTIVEHSPARASNARIAFNDVYIEGITFVGGGRNVHAHDMNNLTIVNSEFLDATGADSIFTLDVEQIVVIDSLVSGSNSDGLSYTMRDDSPADVLEVNVTSVDNGGGGIWNMQGSTAHRNVSVVRVGGLYENNPTNIADIHLGHHWHVGVTARNSSLLEGGEYRNLYVSGDTVNWIVGGSFEQGPEPSVVRSNTNSEIRYVSVLDTLANTQVVGNSPILDDSPLVIVECAEYGEAPATNGGPLPTLSSCPASMALGDLGSGINGTDSLQGSGYLLWSEQDVHDRFVGIHSGAADHLIGVVWDGQQWNYDDGSGVEPYVPVATDCLVAELDYSANTASPLAGVSDVVFGIDAGYDQGDLQVVAQQWRGNFNNGEFQSFGTLLGDPATVPTLSSCPASMALGDLGSGINGTDSLQGSGYLLWSEQDVHDRFVGIHSGAADHLIGVVWDGQQWNYDDGSGVEPYVPVATDCLVAELDYSANTASPLAGVSDVVFGIDAGYDQGDLQVVAQQWRGNFNNGEFEATGTVIG